MYARISLLAVLLLSISVMPAQADVFAENWNDSSSGWQYWIAGTSPSTRGDVLGQNEPMKWSLNRGVDDSGHVWSPSGEWFATWDRLWPAYLAPPPDPPASINLAGQTVSISVNDFGTLAEAGFFPPPLHLFIGEWIANGPGIQDDEYVFFQHKVTLAIEEGHWAQTTFDVGGDDNWEEEPIIRSPGNTKTPSDLYENPQQWGFVIDMTLIPSGVILGFDELTVVPEPSGFLLLSLALVGATLLGWRRRRTV